jgi:hypothetical protein
MQIARMLLTGLLGLSQLLGATSAAASTSLHGVSFPERREIGDQTLQLHSVALLRYRVVFKGYVAALYLGEGVTPDRVLQDVPRRLEIEYFWAIPADAFQRVTREGIARNVDTRELQDLEARIARFNHFYADVQPGDRYSLTYVPGTGTELALNGEARGVIEGEDFAAALFSIWLGKEPFDDGLKSKLLGRS